MTGAALFHAPSHYGIKRSTIQFQESHCFVHGTFIFFSKIRGRYNSNILFFAQQDCLKITKKLAGFSLVSISVSVIFFLIFSFVFLP